MKQPKENVPSRLKGYADSLNNINWACLGKDGFETRDAAQMVVNRMLRRRSKRRQGHIAVYRCPYCNSWHIGGRV